jgi:8-oxo-dGTP pyrophosphatase MutT (NUDIX family)
MTNNRTYTHPDVLSRGVTEGWADPITDPAEIDWAPRQASALIPFKVIDGRPVNPYAPTGIRYGRNQLGHWGEAVAADAIVFGTDQSSRRWLLMIRRDDGHGWAVPGGMVEPGEEPAAAAVRELAEETGLVLDGVLWQVRPARYVPDPRASDESWIVTVPSITTIHAATAGLPVPVGADDAELAMWVCADTYADLVHDVENTLHGTVFPAHREMLAELLR